MGVGKAVLLVGCLLAGCSFHGAALLAAKARPVTQSSPAGQVLETDAPPVADAAQQPQPSQTENPKTKPAKGNKVEKKEQGRRGCIVVAPLPIVSPAIGSGVIPVLGYIFPLQRDDKISPPSVIGAAGMVTNNGSGGFALGADLFVKENRHEIKLIYGRGNVDYKLYGLGYINGSTQPGLPLQQTGQLFFVEFLRNIGWKIFLGPRFIDGDSLITISSPSRPGVIVPPSVGLQTNLTSIGFRTIRDSRTNRFYPTDGMLVVFTADFFSEGLGSKYSFQSYKFHFDKYFGFGQKQVLVYDLFWCGTGGQPPFYGNCIYGADNELRGYQAGRYLDPYMLATQLEYRLALPWRLGLVAFGGIGGVAPGASKFRTNQSLPAGGTGMRFLLSKQYHVNLRTDFAWGKDTFTWSMGIGEAF